MSQVTAQDVRSILLAELHSPLSARAMRPEDVPDNFDLLTEGILDSMGVVEVIASIEKHFRIQIDFEDLEPENLTIVGPFCRYVESKYAAATNTQRDIASNNGSSASQAG